MSKPDNVFFFVLLAVVVFLAGCSPAELEPGTNENVTTGRTDIYVNEIAINIMESFPVQVSATVRGDLADGCVTLNQLKPVAEAGNWVIEGNQYGVCIFEDGSECDEWSFFRGECEPSAEVSWDTAVDLIHGGFVERVFQLHDLTVGLELKDGRSLNTVEPHLDAVFTVIDDCGADCSDIVVATE